MSFSSYSRTPEQASRFRRIDVHAHVLPPSLPDWKAQFGYGGFIQLTPRPDGLVDMVRDDGHFFRTVERNCFDTEARLAEMDAQGIAVQALSTVPVLFSYWAKPKDALCISIHLNNHLASIVEAHPRRFVALATVPLQSTELAVAELRRCMTEFPPGVFSGVQIASHLGGPGTAPRNLDDPALLPFFQECEALGACVFVHPWYMDSPAQQKYWTPWLVGMPAETALAACSLIFGGVLEKCPLLRVGLAHGGGSFPFCLGRIQHGFEVRPDLCAVDNPHPPTQYVQRFYVDSLVHAPKALEYLVDMFTPQRVMLGTDYPFPLGELLAGDLIEQCACCSDEDKQQMLAGTAAEFLGRKDLL